MIDSHCHLDLPAFNDDLSSVLADAANVGIFRVLIPGTTVEGWHRQRSIKLADHANTTTPRIDLAFGLHPYFLHQSEFEQATNLSAALKQLEWYLSDEACAPVAIGEIGLDAVVDVNFDLQVEIFRRQLALAIDAKLPVILHHRKTHHALLHHLKQYKFQYGGVIHAFYGSLEVAKQYIDMGFLLGVGGTITYPRAQKTRNALQQVSLQHLLLESDAPDMPVNGKQGMRNEPRFLTDTLNALAELHHCEPEQVIEITNNNYSQLFLAV